MKTGSKSEFLEAVKSARMVKVQFVPSPYCMFVTANKKELRQITEVEVSLLQWNFSIAENGHTTLFVYHKK